MTASADPEKPVVLVLVFLSEEHRQLVGDTFEMIYAPNEDLGKDRSAGRAAMAARGQDIRIVLTNGTNGILPEEIDALPNLELICTLGVGYENVALDHARARGIPIANAAGTNAECVADHTMMILLAAVRGLLFLDTSTRNGLYRDDLPRPPHISGRRLGLVGMGSIGQAVVRRAQGFDFEIGYCTRSERPELPYPWFADVCDLAEWCDVLVVAAPGGKETHHMVGAQVLDALGPAGVVVNVARGSLLDTAALAQALREGRIMAAALDVYEGEPVAPAELLDMQNVVLTPHIAGISPQAIHNSVVRFIDNTQRHLAGEPLISPVV
ncbi:MAG: 2-hydroxyacid dehydrogenase [Novosphingobium sp.]|nr:2-hydroxyacid dehydrogenase [Novosphingobium sp.]